MAGESDKDVIISEKLDNPSVEEKPKKIQSGLMSRIWNGIIGSRDDDFGRRLERISKEESTILSRIRRRSNSWGKIKMHYILFSVLLEFMAFGYALLNARSVQNWRKRVLYVLPMFLLPAISSVTYTALMSFKKMCEQKDQKTLEELRCERQSKIDELKEKTNYYITQQLIQKYDTDPAAKAAAATVLASKLGADSGLRVYVGDDSSLHPSSVEDNEAISDGLRSRKRPRTHSRSAGNSPVTVHPDGALLQQLGDQIAEHDRPTYVDHYQQEQGSDAYSGNWLSRVAALLVGEDPTECYALICGNCRIHNGLATKEDFPCLTYICPHCRAVNGPTKKDDPLLPSSSSPGAASPRGVDSEHNPPLEDDKEESYQAGTSEDEHNSRP